MSNNFINLVNFAAASGIDLVWNPSAMSFSNKSLDTAPRGPDGWGFTVSPNGLNLYIVTITDGASNPGKIYWYTMTTAWDVSTASYTGISKSISAQTEHTTQVKFSGDGLRMYALFEDANTVFQYTLTTAWNITTASYSGNSKDTNTEVVAARGIALKADGTALYVVDAAGTLYQYPLLVAWDISTASYISQSLSLAHAGESSECHGLTFKPDGTRIILADYFDQSVREYDLTTPWDVTTAVYVGKRSTADQSIAPLDVALNPTGDAMFVMAQDAVIAYPVKLYQYNS